MTDLIIFETHPIQYRVPLYQELNKLIANKIKVVYASDFSVKGYLDKDFNTKFSWDIPLLSGYQYHILEGTSHSTNIEKWNGLPTKGIKEIITKEKPKAIMLCSFSYKFSLVVLFYAISGRIPIWIRMETQDIALNRGFIKGFLRNALYFLLYKFINKFFYIGKLNRNHYLTHGVICEKLLPSVYSTLNSFETVSQEDKYLIRRNIRIKYEISENHFVILFSGKLITKKNPMLILKAVEKILEQNHCPDITCMFIGAGDLQNELLKMSSELEVRFNFKSIFTGFINQSEIQNYYLASDAVVLPSKKMGETWGLVINEGLQAGNSAIISDAAGCSEDFKNLQYVKIFKEGDVTDLADSIESIMNSGFRNTSFLNSIPNYSIANSAKSIADELNKLSA